MSEVTPIWGQVTTAENLTGSRVDLGPFFRGPYATSAPILLYYSDPSRPLVQQGLRTHVRLRGHDTHAYALPYYLGSLGFARGGVQWDSEWACLVTVEDPAFAANVLVTTRWPDLINHMLVTAANKPAVPTSRREPASPENNLIGRWYEGNEASRLYTGEDPAVTVAVADTLNWVTDSIAVLPSNAKRVAKGKPVVWHTQDRPLISYILGSSWVDPRMPLARASLYHQSGLNPVEARCLEQSAQPPTDDALRLLRGLL